MSGVSGDPAWLQYLTGTGTPFPEKWEASDRPEQHEPRPTAPPTLGFALLQATDAEETLLNPELAGQASL